MRFVNCLAPIRSFLAGCVLALAAIMAIHAQPASKPPASPASGAADPASVLRDIYDPSSGARWLLVRDPAHPGGPAKLLLLGASAAPVDRIPGTRIPSRDSLIPAILAGDEITLEVHSGAADGWLEAVALNPARLGASVQVRVKIDGRTLPAIAAGHRRATLAGTEAWR